MSPTIKHHALVALLLWISTACFAQQPVAQGSSSTSSGPQSGVFRPAESSAAPAATQPTPVIGVGKEYRVGPNDLLDIEVMNLDNGKRTVRVNNAGYVTLPLIGSITVAGLTQQQVESHLATLYGEKYLQNPHVSVFIREFTTERITVDGAVSKPGIYPLVGQMTLLRVIALAGGFGQIANRSQVMLFRQSDAGVRQVATFDVDKIRAGQEPDPPIRGDDLIVVQRDSTRAAFTDSLFRDVINVFNPLTYIPR
jgi:polysaccharide export outer membrane protein